MYKHEIELSMVIFYSSRALYLCKLFNNYEYGLPRYHRLASMVWGISHPLIKTLSEIYLFNLGP